MYLESQRSRKVPRTGSTKEWRPEAETHVEVAVTGVGKDASSTPLKTLKLRDSCEACSAAKVRCSKKKPGCARCEKRGLDCEYVATRRAGRPSSTQSPTEVKGSLQNPRPEVSRTDHALSSESLHINTVSEAMSSATPNCILSPLTQQHVNPVQDSLSNSLAYTDATTTPSSFTMFSTEAGNMFAPLESLPDFESPTFNLLPLADCGSLRSNPLDSFNNNMAAFMSEEASNFQDADLELQTAPDIDSIFSHCSPLTTDLLENDPSTCVNSRCSCLMAALEFLKALSPQEMPKHTLTDERLFEEAESTVLTTRSVIEKNEKILGLINDILQRPCSQDSYLLTVLCLVVFKAVDWYAAAAAQAAPISTAIDSHKLNTSHLCCDQKYLSSPSSQYAGSLYADGEDSSRVAAQLVLSELHRAQGLVNKLSTRFKANGLSGSAGAETSLSGSTANSPIDHLYARGNSSPFSSTMLVQMEADLRASLRTTSMRIIKSIRRE